MDDLMALFDNIDGFKDDLMDFGVAGIGAVGAAVAWGFIDKKLVENINFLSTNAAGSYIRNGLAIVVGVVGGMALSKVNKNIATGVAVGLAAKGIAGILGSFKDDQGVPYIPGLPVNSLGMTAAERGLLFPSGTPRGVNTSVEEVNGLSGATTSVEEVNGLSGATTSVEEIGLNGLAATLTA